MSFTLRVDDLLDRANPVLVAEVRRALRGKTFSINFLVLQTIVVLVAVAWGTTASTLDGRDLLGSLFRILALVAYLYVPILAFQSMAGEVDRGSLDHLLAPLRPWRVVLGKWLSSMTLLALLASALLPPACLAVLAGGVDPRGTAGNLLHILVSSAGTTTIALWLGGLTPNRTARTLLLMFLVMTSMFSGMMVARMVVPAGLGGIGWRVGPLVAYAFLGLGGFLAASARIAHPHENKSTPLRVWGTFGVLLAGFGWRGWGGDLVAAFFVLALLWAMGCVFASEPDGDLRWLEKRIPRSRPLALLAAPWLPGGAFGGLWLVLHATLLWLVSGLAWGDSRAIAVMSLLAWSLVILPTSLLPVLRSGVSTKFVRTFSLLLPFLLAAAADAARALIGMRGPGFLERLFELEADRFRDDMGLSAVFLAVLAVYVGGRRALAEWRALEALRRER